MPTPPTGDMACAASPMASSPGRHHAGQPVERDARAASPGPSPAACSTTGASSGAAGATFRAECVDALGLNVVCRALRRRHRRTANNRRGRSRRPSCPRRTCRRSRSPASSPWASETRTRRSARRGPSSAAAALSRRIEVRPSAAIVSLRADSSPECRRTPATRPSSRQQVNRLGLHPQRESRIVPRLLRQEIEEIPLRHQRHEAALDRQMAHVGDGDLLVRPRRAVSVRTSSCGRFRNSSSSPSSRNSSSVEG